MNTVIFCLIRNNILPYETNNIVLRSISNQ